MESMKKIINIFATAALCLPLAAQNFNQTVQVTNDYVTRFADVQKQGGGMRVPDSLYRFDYNFDYSVFETPYKGSYEFSPYRIQVTPQARLYDGRKLYLRAGAGYTLHPQFELAWQMLQEKNYTIGLYADGLGFWGEYGGKAPFKGHDLNGRVAVNGQCLLPSTRLSYSFGYDGIFAGQDVANPAFRSAFNSGVVMGRVQSRERPGNYLFYDFNILYRYSSDSYDAALNQSNVGESSLQVGLSAGPVLKQKYKILIDGFFAMESLRFQDMMFGTGQTTNLGRLRPHLDFELGPVRLDAGVRIDFSVSKNGTDKKTTFAPDVSARFAILDADLELFAGVSGGQEINTHYQLKQLNHFALRSIAPASVSREKLRIRAGAEGHIKAGLQYSVEGGYVSHAQAPLLALGGIDYADYKEIYAQVALNYRSERLQVDGNFRYAHLTLPEQVPAYAPAAITADLRGVWNWDRKVFAGLFAEASSSRRSLTPGIDPMAAYVNLGLTGEYCISPGWTVWVEGGNLIGMAIERMPGFIEKGPYATLGFSLTL